MNTNRKLDAWIAENLFGYRWGHYGYVDSKTGLPELGMGEPIYLSDQQHQDMSSWHPIPRERVDEWKKGAESFPNYSTDTANAMRVLEYCVRNLDRLTGRTDFQIVMCYDEGSVTPYVTTTDSAYDADDNIHVRNCSHAETLEASICWFARALCDVAKPANEKGQR